MTIDTDKLKALALAATPQNFDSAKHKREGGWIECPTCGGDGAVSLGKDYCNYDDAALGVQFYGIGDEHVNAEAYYRAANPATVLELIAERDELRAEVERLRADADVERWRFRKQFLAGGGAIMFSASGCQLRRAGELVAVGASEEEAIDAAIAAKDSPCGS